MVDCGVVDFPPQGLLAGLEVSSGASLARCRDSILPIPQESGPLHSNLEVEARRVVADPLMDNCWELIKAQSDYL